MNKSIHDEALLKLKEIAEHLTRKQWLELTSNIELIRNHLQKQEKLLKFYKELVIIKDYMLDFYDVPDDNYDIMEKRETYLQLKIKELEK